MYNECISCQKMGKTCGGPNFVAMPASELAEWCRERKKHLGLSNQQIAELANMSKGTVDGLLASVHPDFRYETIRPLLNALIGCEWNEKPCDALTDSERAEMLHKLQQCEKTILWQDEKIQYYTEENKRLQEELASMGERHHKSQDFMRGEMKRKNRIIAILAASLGIALAVIIGALVVDRINSDIGFFWLGSNPLNIGTQIITRTIG